MARARATPRILVSPLESRLVPSLRVTVPLILQVMQRVQRVQRFKELMTH